jgi:hypothetical protein
VIEHYLHRTLTPLDRIVLGHDPSSSSMKEAASNPARFSGSRCRYLRLVRKVSGNAAVLECESQIRTLRDLNIVEPLPSETGYVDGHQDEVAARRDRPRGVHAGGKGAVIHDFVIERDNKLR